MQKSMQRVEDPDQGIMEVDDQGHEFSFEMIREITEEGEDSDY